MEYGTPRWNISYFPQNDLLDKFFDTIAKELSKNNNFNVRVQAFESSESLKRAVGWENVLVGVEFHADYKYLKVFPKNFRFRLRFPSEMRTEEFNPMTNNWKTNELFPSNLLSKPRGFNSSFGGFEASYISEGFITIQYYIATQYIREVLAARKMHSHTNYQDMNLSLVRLPDPPYYIDNYIDKTSFIVLSLIPFAYLSIFVRTVFLIAEEKER